MTGPFSGIRGRKGSYWRDPAVAGCARVLRQSAETRQIGTGRRVEANDLVIDRGDEDR